MIVDTVDNGHGVLRMVMLLVMAALASATAVTATTIVVTAVAFVDVGVVKVSILGRISWVDFGVKTGKVNGFREDWFIRIVHRIDGPDRGDKEDCSNVEGAGDHFLLLLLFGCLLTCSVVLSSSTAGPLL